MREETFQLPRRVESITFVRWGRERIRCYANGLPGKIRSRIVPLRQVAIAVLCPFFGERRDWEWQLKNELPEMPELAKAVARGLTVDVHFDEDLGYYVGMVARKDQFLLMSQSSKISTCLEMLEHDARVEWANNNVAKLLV